MKVFISESFLRTSEFYKQRLEKLKGIVVDTKEKLTRAKTREKAKHLTPPVAKTPHKKHVKPIKPTPPHAEDRAKKKAGKAIESAKQPHKEQAKEPHKEPHRASQIVKTLKPTEGTKLREQIVRLAAALKQAKEKGDHRMEEKLRNQLAPLREQFAKEFNKEHHK
jgi:hypothetical protein